MSSTAVFTQNVTLDPFDTGLMASDEETPLLQGKPKTKRTPLPILQICIVLVLQAAEPLTSHVLYPFAPQLIRDIGITNGDETQVGYYVGALSAMFFFAQAFTVLQWSRLSDHIGRRPVIIGGLFGLSLTMAAFGVSKTFVGLMLSRSLTGVLNGNIGVEKSIIAEITDETNIGQAYALSPIAWSSGSILGPLIGGTLARPAETFPELLGDFKFLEKYPYFLPCIVPAIYSAIACLIASLFLKETVKRPLSIREFLGFGGSESEDRSAEADEEKPLPLRELLTPSVILAGGNYGMISLVEIAFRGILPLFFSTPIDLGGLGFSTFQIGQILSVTGVLTMVFQFFFFARMHDYLGSKKTVLLGLCGGFPLFLTFPLLTWLAKTQGITIWVWSLIGLQMVAMVGIISAYGAIFIYIAAAAPNKASLGATNGLCQLAVSLFRAVGPAAATSLFSLSLQHDLLGGQMVYYVLLLVVAVGVLTASLLPNHQVTRR